MSVYANFISGMLKDESLLSHDDANEFIRGHSSCLRLKNSEGDLPIHTECAHYARYDLICDMIEMYPESLQIPGHNQQLPMHRAIFGTASEEVVLMLIDKYPDAVKQREEGGALPILAECLLGGRIKVFSKLIEVYPESLEIPCLLRIEYPPLETALLHKACSLDAISFLVACNPNSVRRRDRNGHLPIHVEAEMQCRWSVIKLFLEEYPESERIRDAAGFAPLHTALYNENDSATEVVLNLIKRCPEVLRMRTCAGFNVIQIECLQKRRLDIIKKCVALFPESLAIAGKKRVPYECLVHSCFMADDFGEKKDVLAYVISECPNSFSILDNQLYEDTKKTLQINRFLLNLVPHCLPSTFLRDCRDYNWIPRAAAIKALLQLKDKVSPSQEEAKEDKIPYNHEFKSSNPLAASAIFCAKLFENFDSRYHSSCHDTNQYCLGDDMDPGSVWARHIVSYL